VLPRPSRILYRCAEVADFLGLLVNAPALRDVPSESIQDPWGVDNHPRHHAGTPELLGLLPLLASGILKMPFQSMYRSLPPPPFLNVRPAMPAKLHPARIVV